MDERIPLLIDTDPGVDDALALLMAFGRRGLIGQALSVFGISLPFTPAAVVMAQLFVAAPLYIRAAALGYGPEKRVILLHGPVGRA